MTKKNFDGSSEFTDETFESVQADNGNLVELRFENCTFERCTFQNASLSGSSLFECIFRECDLSNIQIIGARIRDVNFLDSKLVGINWASVTTASGISFRKCVLNYSIFENLDLKKASFEECVLREADFTQANLSEATFKGTDLLNTRFSNTNLTKTDFRKSINYLIHPTENKIKKAKFSLPEATALLYGLGIELEE